MNSIPLVFDDSKRKQDVPLDLEIRQTETSPVQIELSLIYSDRTERFYLSQPNAIQLARQLLQATARP